MTIFNTPPSAYFGSNLTSGFSTYNGGASTVNTPEKNSTMPGTAPSAYRPALTRSSSVQPHTNPTLNTTTTATRSRLNLSRTSSVCTVPTVIPESSIISTTTTAASDAAFNALKDTGFRNRAFSEGANGASQLQQQLQQQQQQQVQSSRYKTELCRPFEENGKCKYSDKCQFAHGKHELRSLVRHPKYKTELCRTFHTSGFCPYGPRCHFIHNTEDGSTNRQGNPQNNDFSQNNYGQTVPVPTPQGSVANHYQNSRPAQLELIGKQYSTDSGLGGYGQSYSPNSNSPLGTSPITDILGSTGLISPLSPASNGNRFSFNNNYPQTDISGFRQNSISSNMLYGQPDASPPNSTFELLKQISNSVAYETNDEAVFEGPPTPPDSDRESMTGSPSNRSPTQRLPIFRCLSHSD